MPPIETIVRPRRNRISIPIPTEYGKCSFQVILVPLATNSFSSGKKDTSAKWGKKSFVDALLACPKLGEGESLDISRDDADFGRDVEL